MKEIEVDLSGIVDAPRKLKSKKIEEHVYGFDFNKSNSFDDRPEIPVSFTESELKVVQRVLRWASGFFKSDLENSRVKNVSARKLMKIFGQNKFGKDLSKMLLVIEDGTWNFNPERGENRTKSFTLDLSRFFELSTRSGQTLKKSLEEAVKPLGIDFESELRTGRFTYTRTHYRKYNQLIVLPKLQRDELMMSHGYQYEIDACAFAPSLLSEVAQLHGMVLPAVLRKFLDDPRRFRVEVAGQTGLPVQVVKESINAVLHGAKTEVVKEFDYSYQEDGSFIATGKFKKFALLRICGSEANYLKLKRNVLFTGLTNSFLQLVQFLDEKGEVLVPDDFDKKLKLGQKTYLIYTRYEEQIQEVLQEEIDKLGERCLMVHDGAYLSAEIEVDKLTKLVQQKLGIRVSFQIEPVVGVE